ncbi:MAG: SGNH/GDSL hydrolase family protein [Myxococcales bacterium]|nr:MAG: SGNH/GDSL hydrolase family protein [Myxococcales bacterium]
MVHGDVPPAGGRRRAAMFALALVLCIVVPYLAIEGLLVVLGGGSATTSLAHRTYAALLGASTPDLDPGNAYTWMVVDRGEIERRIDALEAAGVGMGNSPIAALKTDAAAINTVTTDGCQVQKPGVRKRMSYLRSNLFNPFDQITYFHDADAEIDADLASFFGRYGFRTVTLTTNDAGERVTVPDIAAHDVVLIAGDSIANGAMLDDSETLASALQRGDDRRRYVNLGVSRAKADDIACLLNRAAERYTDRIRSVIYVFCENDFDPSRPNGRPSELIAWIARYRDRVGADPIVFLYVPYIYNAAPEITRVRGHSHHGFPAFIEEKRELLTLARDAGFEVIDFLDASNAVRDEDGTQFAPLRLYVDHSHLSPVGVERAVNMIRSRDGRRHDQSRAGPAARVTMRVSDSSVR